jgi:hypothetical protein
MHAGNGVEVLYRLNQEPVQIVPAKWMWNDHFSKAQYFRAQLPAFRAGDTVEYTAICHCVGRQVPSPEEAKRLSSSFRVTGTGAEPALDFASRQTPLTAPGMATGSHRIATSPGAASQPVATPEVSRFSPTKEPKSGDTGSGLEAPSLERSPVPLAEQPFPAGGPSITKDHVVDRQSGAGLENGGDAQRDVQVSLQFSQPETETLENLAPVIGLKGASKLLRYLSKNGIRTLADIRHAGGLRQLDGLQVEPDGPNLHLLEAHMNQMARISIY